MLSAAEPNPALQDGPNPQYPLNHLLEANKEWAKQQLEADPEVFVKAAAGQAPPILYIGCSDSRVPPNILGETMMMQITICSIAARSDQFAHTVGLGPGDMFVHRNIANVFDASDLNLLSVIQYAVEYLKVKHIIVCGKILFPQLGSATSTPKHSNAGHYGCGGVNAAISGKQFGLIDNWLSHIKDTHWICQERVDAVEDAKLKGDLMSELNVIRSALNVVNTTIVKNAWARGQPVSVHAWCYRLEDGIIRCVLAERMSLVTQLMLCSSWRLRRLSTPVDTEEEIKMHFEEVFKSKTQPQYVNEKN